jgi:hypothetical protein
VRIRVNTWFYEPILRRWLDARRPEDEDSLSLPRELAEDLDFVTELCNGAQSSEPSRANPDKLLWVKRWPEQANDYRDCLKYARCAMDVKFRGDWRKALRRQVGGSPAAPAANRPLAIPVEDERSRRGRRAPRHRLRRERLARR